MGTKAIQWFKSFDWTMTGILISIFFMWQIGVGGYWDTRCWILLFLCLLGVRKHQENVEWPKFFIFAIPILVIFWYINKTGVSFWWGIANHLFEKSKHIWVWDNFMNSIPGNNAAFFRVFHRVKLDRFMAWVYSYGFVLPLWIGIFHSFWSRSIKKVTHYALSGHLMQLPLILPFYNLILLHEVWFVKEQPDLLYRHFADHNAMLVTVMNCFPSMHTSISFAMLLLALREKDTIYKYLMVAYCSGIIFATMYLQIHWILDVIAGLLFGYGVVKLADLLIYLFTTKLVPAKFKGFYLRNSKKFATETSVA